MMNQSQKSQIYDMLAGSYVDLVTKGVIGKMERKVLSKRILENVEKAHSYGDVYSFLDALVKTYPSFTYALAEVKGEIGKVHEIQIMNQLKGFIKSATK